MVPAEELPSAPHVSQPRVRVSAWRSTAMVRRGDLGLSRCKRRLRTPCGPRLQSRLLSQVLPRDFFNLLREQKGSGFEEFIREHMIPFEADMDKPLLGIAPDMLAELHDKARDPRVGGHAATRSTALCCKIAGRQCCVVEREHIRTALCRHVYASHSGRGRRALRGEHGVPRPAGRDPADQHDRLCGAAQSRCRLQAPPGARTAHLPAPWARAIGPSLALSSSLRCYRV